jgi:hypothetical protein
MGIDENVTADQSASNTYSHPLMGPQPAFGIPTEVARRVTREWIYTKHDHYKSLLDQGKTAGELLSMRLN